MKRLLGSYRKSRIKITQRTGPTPEPSAPATLPWPIRRWQVAVGCCALLSLAGRTRITERADRLTSPPALAAVDTATSDTVTGVVKAHDEAVRAFTAAFGYFVWDGGMLTDELRDLLNGLTVRDLPPRTEAPPAWWNFTSKDIWRRFSLKDVRMLPERLNPRDTAPDEDGKDCREAGYFCYIDHAREAFLDEGYLEMQGARAYLSTGVGQLHTAPLADSAVVKVSMGDLYALEGYTYIMLADLYCSGVPLNTFTGVPIVRLGPLPTNVDKDYYLQTFGTRNVAYKRAIAEKQVVYRSGSATKQVYLAAIAKFDTVLSFAGNSARTLNLARVGKGRAWLALGQYDSAAAVVAQVPQGFAYTVHRWMNMDPDGDEQAATVADREGHNGLPYISSGDPRTATKLIEGDKLVKQVRVPAKWSELGKQGMGAVTLTLASWEEAVLIQAEADLHKELHVKHRSSADTTWLHLLNQLRATAPIPGTTQPDPAKLAPLKDPGTEHSRIALLFAERAYWLFLTGHRQGDMRRLVREYHWPQDQVYPTGPYIVPQGYVGQVGKYGTDVNMPIPPEELSNPLFHGCLDRGA